MSIDGSRYDAVVIGGGFAGVTAARDLTDQGKTVLLLEAQDRLGGRAYTSTFPGTDTHIELGGQFIMPGGNVMMESEMARYGVEAGYVPDPDGYPTILAGKRNPGPFPVPIEQMFDLERAAVHCVLAASRITPGVPFDQQEIADLDIPLSDFLAPLALPQETYEFVTTIGQFVSFRDPEEGSALQLLSTLSDLGLSPLSLWGAMGAHINTSDLLTRMAADVTEVQLGCPVARVDQTGSDVLITTVAGETVSASAVVVAVPINIWNDIEFAPLLSEVKRVTSAERHATDRSGKVWVRVRNAPSRPFVLASPQSTGSVFALFTEEELDGGDVLMGMFGLVSREGETPVVDFGDRACVEEALATMLPGAELVEFASHNYNTDPYSKGDWISWKPGRASKSYSALGAAEGRLTFATSDIAPKWIMTLEGAVECGHRAAQQTLNHLVREREAALVRGASRP